MENDETKPKKKRTPQDAPICIRLTKEERAAFQSIARDNSKPVSTLIRECCIAHLNNKLEHQKFLTALAPEDPKEVQKTFSDLINNNTEVTIKILSQIREDVITYNEQMDELLRRVIYLEFYFGQRFDDKDNENRAKWARSMVKQFFQRNLRDEMNKG